MPENEMESNTVGIGLIGCGLMGMIVVRDLLKADPRIEVRGLCDPDTRSVNKACEDLGYEPPVFDDYKDLVRRPDVEWVFIASWNSQHCDHAVAALEAGKHVFCQKPLGITAEQCLRMYTAWKRSGKMFNIGFSLRYSPYYRKIKELIAGGAVGRVLSMEFNETVGIHHGGYIMSDWRRLRKNTGFHMLEKCCHDMDLVNWFLESRVNRVASFGGLDFYLPENEYHIERLGKDKNGKDAYRNWHQSLIGVNPFTSDKSIIDNQVVIMEFENKARATFHTNLNAAIPERRMYILGTEGAIRCNMVDKTIELKRTGHDTQIEKVEVNASGGHGGGNRVLGEELSASIFQGVAPAVGMLEGLESAFVCFAIDEAMRTGTVVDAKPYWDDFEIEKAEYEPLSCPATA